MSINHTLESGSCASLSWTLFEHGINFPVLYGCLKCILIDMLWCRIWCLHVFVAVPSVLSWLHLSLFDNISLGILIWLKPWQLIWHVLLYLWRQGEESHRGHVGPRELGAEHRCESWWLGGGYGIQRPHGPALGHQHEDLGADHEQPFWPWPGGAGVRAGRLASASDDKSISLCDYS